MATLESKIGDSLTKNLPSLPENSIFNIFNCLQLQQLILVHCQFGQQQRFLYVFDFVPLRKHLKLFNIHKFPFFTSDSCDEWTSAGCSECVTTLDDVTSDCVTVIRIAGEWRSLAVDASVRTVTTAENFETYFTFWDNKRARLTINELFETVLKVLFQLKV